MDNLVIIDTKRHNCSHCGTKSAKYENVKFVKLDEHNEKSLCCMFLKCAECGKISMHLIKNLKLSKEFIYCMADSDEIFKEEIPLVHAPYGNSIEISVENIKNNIIMSIPTPKFIVNNKIPTKLRHLLIEALNCIKENALVGASACIRKALYEFLLQENASGKNYTDKIKSIKGKWNNLDEYLDVLIGIKGLTSDKIHEESFCNFSSDDAKTCIKILEEIFVEVYVIPEERKNKKKLILERYSKAKEEKK